MCFGCGKSGSVLHGDLAKPDDFFYDSDFTLADEAISKLEIEYKGLKAFDLDEWRTIPRKTVLKVGGAISETMYPKLVLPVYINRQLKGVINCAFDKNKNFPSYIYSSGNWITSSLFPYDHAIKMSKKIKTLFLVEGPRDALKLIQFGIPAVANLGGTTVFSKRKVELIEESPFKKIILAFDTDTVGRELTKLYHESLRFYHPAILKMPQQGDEKMDPAALPEEFLKRIYRLIK
jgi:5S rRNA maturation endonuclease (ribonuclease M5)